MPACTNCRRTVEATTDGAVDDTVLVRLCDDCMDEIVGDRSAKKLEFEG